MDSLVVSEISVAGRSASSDLLRGDRVNITQNLSYSTQYFLISLSHALTMQREYD